MIVRCSFCAQLRTGLCCHGIFRIGFLSVFQSKKRGLGAASMQDLVGALLSDVVKLSDAADTGHAAFLVPDIAPSKIQGVRAKKSAMYIGRMETVSELFVSILATGPLEQYLYWLFKKQEEDAWLDSDPHRRPIVALTSAANSPVVVALAKYTAMFVEHPPLESETLVHFSGASEFVLVIDDYDSD